jgi:integrase
MRVQQRASAVFRYGISTGRCSRDPAADLRGAFTPVVTNHYAALGEQALPEFFQKLAEYDGEPTTRLALRLMTLTFVRTVEWRMAQWSEFDINGAIWRIPAERMKSREDHIVPLSRQALAVLEELKPLTGRGTYVFPHRGKDDRPMSENTMLYALYRMGYHSRATGHGFRATASTILNERGFKPDVIERQLAHAPKDKTRAAYNRSQYLAERKTMMQQWADLLDELSKPNSNVFAGKFGRTAG